MEDQQCQTSLMFVCKQLWEQKDTRCIKYLFCLQYRRGTAVANTTDVDDNQLEKPNTRTMDVIELKVNDKADQHNSPLPNNDVDDKQLKRPNTRTMDVIELEVNDKATQHNSPLPNHGIAPRSFLPQKQRNSKSDNMCFRCLKHTPHIPDEVEIMGLNPIFQNDSHIFRRLFWASIVLFGIGFAGFQIQSQISLYLSWPVNVLVNISHVTELHFPRVIFCNYNFMRKSAFPQNLTGVNTTDVSRLFEADIANGLYQNVDWEDVYVNFSHQLNETLLEVSKCYSLYYYYTFALPPPKKRKKLTKILTLTFFSKVNY